MSKVLSDEFFASFFAENDEVLIHSFESKKSLDKKEEPCHGSSGVETKHSGDEDMKIKEDKILFASIRQSIIVIASKELGTREATDNNDGPRIEEYLRYTSLGKGYDWCAAFVSWVYGQAGLDVPRNPWSPALFPKARQISKDQCRSADVFGIYGSTVKRINHVGLIKKKQGEYLITIEGNSNNRVESRRRHLRTVYAIADWVNE
ncbi:MAG: C40 family peptidase [Sphingobacterium sp.]|nr:C40 family peptidase [Sphingobacterium sp.]